jgi:quercetin dioxygenase-like cupin family protein
MALPGQEATHAITGDRIRYLEVGGNVCRVELIRKPGTWSVGDHRHTVQTESFDVIAGQARYLANGTEGTLVAGQTVSFPPGTPHINPWNDGDEELRIIQFVSPALDFDLLHETLYVEFPAKGLVKEDGSAKFLPQCVVLHETQSKTYSSKLPEGLQRFIFAALAPIGRLMGYRYGKAER